jgi:hypothetical protein
MMLAVSLLVGELAAFLLRLHQPGGKVLARLPATQLEQPLEIRRRGEVAGVGGIEFGASERHGVEQPAALACAVEEHLVVLGRYAEHVADHRDR